MVKSNTIFRVILILAGCKTYNIVGICQQLKGRSVVDGALAGQRIKVLMEQRGWSLGTLSDRSGVDKGHLSVMLRGRVPNPGAGTLGKIAEALGVPLSEITGERRMSPRRTTVIEGVVVVPVSTIRVQASGDPLYDDTPDMVTTLSKYAISRAEHLRAAVVTGDCMHPHVNAGDIVIFDPQARTPQDRQMVVVLDADGSTLVKWYRLGDEGAPYLRAADGTEIRPNGARVIGTVIDISRRPARDPD